jgi:hypothetical protein
MKIYQTGDTIPTIYGALMVIDPVYENGILTGYNCKPFPGQFGDKFDEVFMGLDSIKFDGIKSK